MGKDSKIEWTHHTANLWHGCTKVHAGCDNCYAETATVRWGRNLWGNGVPRWEIKSVWKKLEEYQIAAQEANEMHSVFVGSMMDIFEKPMPMVNSKGELIADKNTGMLRDLLFSNISAGKYPNLMFLLLTKRPSNINKYIPKEWKENPPSNVMFGTSPVNQETAEKLIPQLLRVNGKRFLSVEPQLDKIDLTHIDADKGGDKEWCWINCLSGRHTDMGRPCLEVPQIHWVIQGGESGHHKRPFNLEWAYKMKEDCKKYGVPYFFKQIDKKQSIPDDLMVREFPIPYQNIKGALTSMGIYDSANGDSIFAHKMFDATHICQDSKRCVIKYATSVRGKIVQVCDWYEADRDLGTTVHFFIDEITPEDLAQDEVFALRCKVMQANPEILANVIFQNR